MSLQLRTTVIDGVSDGPHLLITGGVHGDEFEPPLAIHALARRPELAALRGKLTLVPIVNEAAFARASRMADDGLDLARTCPGRPDGSVTEQAAFALAELIRTANFYVDLHTGGTALSIWPLVGYTLHPRRDVLGQQRELARAFNLPVIWGTDPNLEGRSLSVARDANVPAIYAEYEGGGRCSLQAIQSYIDGCLNVMGHVGMIERPRPPTTVQFVVEDPRPQSGHMQRCYPSPIAGLFEPAVDLGQPIAAGQPLGTVVNLSTGESRTVLSTQNGRVLVLRVFPPVSPRDSLAVVLELDPSR